MPLPPHPGASAVPLPLLLVSLSEWLSPEEDYAFREWIRASRRLYDQLGKELQARHKLSIGDFEILVRLSEGKDRRMRMSELAEATLASRSRLSHQIDRMQKVGLVQREGAREDGRGLYAVLTDQGESVLATTLPFYVQGVRAHLFDVVTARDAAAMGKVCEKVNAHLDAVAAGPDPAAGPTPGPKRRPNQPKAMAPQ